MHKDMVPVWNAFWNAAPKTRLVGHPYFNNASRQSSTYTGLRRQMVAHSVAEAGVIVIPAKKKR